MLKVIPLTPVHNHNTYFTFKQTIFLPSEGAVGEVVVVGGVVGIVGDVTPVTFPELVFMRLAAFTLSFVGGGGRSPNPLAVGLGTGSIIGCGEKSFKSGDIGGVASGCDGLSTKGSKIIL